MQKLIHFMETCIHFMETLTLIRVGFLGVRFEVEGWGGW